MQHFVTRNCLKGSKDRRMEVEPFITHNGHWEYVEYTSTPLHGRHRNICVTGTQKRQEVFKLNQEG
jgi:uncharacterized protein YchJ